MFVYTGCLNNELAALHNRHLVRKVQPCGPRVAMVGRYWKRFARLRPTPVWREKEVLAHTKPVRKERVRRAFERARLYGLTRTSEKIKAFIKHEKAALVYDDPPDQKDPRMIQYRSFEFCALFQQFVMPFEQEVFSLGQNGRPDAPVEERLFAKGLRPQEVALNLRYGWMSVEDPVADLWDVSRMDAHMGQWVRELIEFASYRRMNPGCAGFLDTQRMNECYTRNGIRYEMRYTMCSGEACTSLGDSIVMAAVLKYAYRGTKCHVLVNGDDSVVIRPRGFVPDESVFKDCGLPVKREFANVFEEVEFCQCRPVCLSDGWTMVRNPDRVLSRTLVTLKNYGPAKNRKWLASVGLCELYQNAGVPILQDWALHLLSYGTPSTKMLADLLDQRGWPLDEVMRAKAKPISGRVGFAQAWGYVPDLQQRMEEVIRNMCVELGDRAEAQPWSGL